MTHVADTVYHALKATHCQVKEPGKDGLVIPFDLYAQSLGIGVSRLRYAINYLHNAGRIHARKLDYPSPIVEQWQISFPTEASSASYTVSAHQRERVFAHALGLIIHLDILHDWEEADRPLDGGRALDVFLRNAQQYHYEDVRATFNALPGNPYSDFMHYYDCIAPLKPRNTVSPNQEESESRYGLDHHWEEQQAIHRDDAILYTHSFKNDVR